jgi:uncharacterized RDD family membrane protein YckC
MANAGDWGSTQPGPGGGPGGGYPPPPWGSQTPGAQPPPGYQQGAWYPPAPPLQYGYTQAAPPGMHVDPASGLVLPIGVELASAGRRIGAYFLAIPLSIVTLFIGYIIWGAIVWSRGQTPTYQVLGMRCWRPDTGRVAGWGWMAMREIIGGLVEGILSFVTEIISFVMMLATKERKCLHDMVAGTVVVRDPDNVLLKR